MKTYRFFFPATFTSKRIFISILFLFTFLFSFSQSGIQFGYNAGCFTPPMRNLEVLTADFNYNHPNYTDQYNFTNIYHGVTIATYDHSSNFVSWGKEFAFSNKTIRSSAMGQDLPTDTIFKHKLKVDMNTISLGGYYQPGNNIKFGLDWDLGLCRITKKVGPKDSFGSAKWEPVFKRKGLFVCAATLYVDAKIGPVSIRPYWQWSALPFGMSNESRTKEYAFPLTNFGVALYIGTSSDN